MSLNPQYFVKIMTVFVLLKLGCKVTYIRQRFLTIDNIVFRQDRNLHLTGKHTGGGSLLAIKNIPSQPFTIK